MKFISSKDSGEKHSMHSKGDDRENMIGNDTDEIIQKFFNLLLSRYKVGLGQPMKSGDYVFDYVEALYYKCHKISLNRGGSYTESPKWINDKKVSINPQNSDDKCFQYAVAVALNYERDEKNP